MKLREIMHLIRINYGDISVLDRIHVFIRAWIVPWDPIFKHVPQKGKLLDYGCGHGLFLAYCLLKRPHLELIGFDPDQHKSAILKRMNGVRSIEGIQKNDSSETYNCIVIMDVLYCVEKELHDKILRELSDKLEKGGALIMKEIVSQPFYKRLFNILHEILTMKILRITKGSVLELRPKRYYENIILEAGFELTISEPIHKGYLWPHHLFVAIKR